MYFFLKKTISFRLCSGEYHESLCKWCQWWCFHQQSYQLCIPCRANDTSTKGRQCFKLEDCDRRCSCLSRLLVRRHSCLGSDELEGVASKLNYSQTYILLLQAFSLQKVWCERQQTPKVSTLICWPCCARCMSESFHKWRLLLLGNSFQIHDAQKVCFSALGSKLNNAKRKKKKRKKKNHKPLQLKPCSC